MNTWISLRLPIAAIALTLGCTASFADSRVGSDMVRLRLLASVSIADGVVTGVAGADFQHMRAPASRQGVCQSLLTAERAVRAGVLSARITDSNGNVIVTCE